MVLNRKTEYGRVPSAGKGMGSALPPRLTSIGLLLIFVASLLCLCGALGYQHVGAPGPAVSVEAHPESAPDEREAEHGPAAIAYTATALAAASALALFLLAGPARTTRLDQARRYVRRPPPKAVRLTAKGPTRPQLQVFLI